MKLLLDQGLPRSTAVLLRSAGWDVEHVSERNMSAASDTEILAVAKQEQKIVITLDADFHALLAVSSATGPSVVRIRIEGMNGASLAAMFTATWPKVGDALQAGAMVTINERGIRIKHLPI